MTWIFLSIKLRTEMIYSRLYVMGQLEQTHILKMDYFPTVL